MKEKTYIVKVKVYKDTDFSELEKHLDKLYNVTDVDLLEVYND